MDLYLRKKLSFHFCTNANFNDNSLIFPAMFLPTSENIWYPILTKLENGHLKKKEVFACINDL